MADYFSPTVIQPSIRLADMTPLESQLLRAIFDAEPDGEALYFHSRSGPNDMLELSVVDLHAPLAASAGIESSTSTFVAERLLAAADDAAEIEIDLSDRSWAIIFQDIVRRSPTLEYVTAITSFTRSKMRPDGFGGMAMVITADGVTGKSTQDILRNLLKQAERWPEDGR